MFNCKLTPTFYVNRAIKAKTFDEFALANMGLINLYNSHIRHALNLWFDFLQKLHNPVLK